MTLAASSRAPGRCVARATAGLAAAPGCGGRQTPPDFHVDEESASDRSHARRELLGVRRLDPARPVRRARDVRLGDGERQRERTVIIREQVPLVPAASARRAPWPVPSAPASSRTTSAPRYLMACAPHADLEHVCAGTECDGSVHRSESWRSNRNVCVPGGSSSRCTGRSPRNSPST